MVAEVKEVGLARQDGEQWSSERIVIDAMYKELIIVFFFLGRDH